MTVFCILLGALVGCQSSQPVDLFAQQTQQAALTGLPTAPTPDLSPTPPNAPTLMPAPTLAPTSAQVGGADGGLSVSIVEAQTIPDYWLPADGRTTATVRVSTLTSEFAGRPVSVIASGGGNISGGAATTAAVGGGVDFTYTADVAAGTKRIEAQVTMADGHFEVRTAPVIVKDENPSLSGELFRNDGGSRIRLTVTGEQGVLRGIYPVRVLTDASLARLLGSDGADIPAEGVLPILNSDGIATAEVAVQRLTEAGNINLSAFLVGRGESTQWRDTLYPQYAARLSFSQLNGVYYENMPEGNDRYMWDARTINRRWCAELRGAGDVKPPLVTFKISPILELNPGGSSFVMENQPLTLGQMAQTDEDRFRGTNFVADYDVCGYINFSAGTGGVYWLEVTPGLLDVVGRAPAVVYSGGGANFAAGGLWVGLYDFDGTPLPPIQIPSVSVDNLNENNAPYIYFLEPQTPQSPAHAVVIFWAQIDPVAAQEGAVKPSDGQILRLTGRITSYESENIAPYQVATLTGLGRAWIFVDGAGARYTRTVRGEIWTRVYTIARIASAADQLTTP